MSNQRIIDLINIAKLEVEWNGLIPMHIEVELLELGADLETIKTELGV